jgi:hypothetical protein
MSGLQPKQGFPKVAIRWRSREWPLSRTKAEMAAFFNRLCMLPTKA